MLGDFPLPGAVKASLNEVQIALQHPPCVTDFGSCSNSLLNSEESKLGATSQTNLIQTMLHSPFPLDLQLHILQKKKRGDSCEINVNNLLKDQSLKMHLKDKFGVI